MLCRPQRQTEAPLLQLLHMLQRTNTFPPVPKGTQTTARSPCCVQTAAAASDGYKATPPTSASVLPFSTVMPALVDSTSPGLYNHTATKGQSVQDLSKPHGWSYVQQAGPCAEWWPGPPSSSEHQPRRKQSNWSTSTSVNDTQACLRLLHTLQACNSLIQTAAGRHAQHVCHTRLKPPCFTTLCTWAV